MAFDLWHSAGCTNLMSNQIARLRLARRLTQQQLADFAGTSQPQIKRLEKGQRKLTKEWAERLAPYLGTTPEALLFPEARRRSSLDRLLDELPPELADEIHEDVERRILTTRRLLEGRRQ